MPTFLMLINDAFFKSCSSLFEPVSMSSGCKAKHVKIKQRTSLYGAPILMFYVPTETKINTCQNNNKSQLFNLRDGVTVIA